MDVRDTSAIAGVALIGIGVSLFSFPAGLITVGVILLSGSLLGYFRAT